MANRYRICKNTGPHRSDPWWTVERESMFFGVGSWRPVRKYYAPGVSVDWAFSSESDAQNYINKAKIERTHVCGEPQ